MSYLSQRLFVRTGRKNFVSNKETSSVVKLLELVHDGRKGRVLRLGPCRGVLQSRSLADAFKLYKYLLCFILG